MSPLVQRYRELLAEAEAESNEVVRDRRLDDADEVWGEMTPEQRDEVDEDVPRWLALSERVRSNL